MPDWMDVEFLERKIAEERESERFSDVPFHYQELGKLFKLQYVLFYILFCIIMFVILTCTVLNE
jgi:hypothetical protein